MKDFCIFPLKLFWIFFIENKAESQFFLSFEWSHVKHIFMHDQFSRWNDALGNPFLNSPGPLDLW